MRIAFWLSNANSFFSSMVCVFTNHKSAEKHSTKCRKTCYNMVSRHEHGEDITSVVFLCEIEYSNLFLTYLGKKYQKDMTTYIIVCVYKSCIFLFSRSNNCIAVFLLIELKISATLTAVNGCTTGNIVILFDLYTNSIFRFKMAHCLPTYLLHTACPRKGGPTK